MICCRILGILLLFASAGLQAQEIDFHGKVIDAINRLPLQGALVSVDSSSSAITDAEGKFVIIASKGDSAVITFLGYRPSVISLESLEAVISMLPDDRILEAVVVSGYERKYSSLNTGASMGVLGLKELKRDNNVQIVPSISRVPGVLMQSGALNTNRLTIRGIGARTPFGTSKIRAYLNNIPLTTGDGSTTIEDIDLDIIQRVEVLKGPTSSIYGAGLGGTVLLDASSPVNEVSGVRSEIIAGSYGLIKSNTDLQIVDEGVNIGIGYNYLHSDGYRENNQYDRQSFVAAGSIDKQNTTISFFANFLDLKAFIPSSIDSAAFAEDPRQAAFTWASVEGFEDYKKGLFGLSVKQNFSDHFVAAVSLFQSTYESYELRPFNILTETTQATGTRAIFSFIELGSVLKNISIGTEYFNDTYKWQTYENNGQQLGATLSDNVENRNNINFFGQLGLRLTPTLRLDAGVNFNMTRYTIDDRYVGDSIDQSGSYSFENILSPRVALLYSVGPEQNIYATVSHGFSPPSLPETLTPAGQINPDIQPEKGYNYELGYKGYPVRDLYLDASVYTMQIKDLLVAKRITADQFIGLNAGKTSHSGFELYSKYNRQSGSLFISPFINYTFANYLFSEFIDDNNDYSGNELTGVPRHQADLGIEVSHGIGTYGSLNYTYVGAMPMRDDNSKYSEAYGVTNLKLGWLSSPGRFTIDIYGGIQNIFDVKYASMILVNAPSFGGRPARYYYPGLPINYYGGLSVRYSFSSL